MVSRRCSICQGVEEWWRRCPSSRISKRKLGNTRTWFRRGRACICHPRCLVKAFITISGRWTLSTLSELGIEIRQGRKYSKIRPMSGSIPNSFAVDSRPLATNINQEKCHGQAGSWIVLHVFHLPVEERSNLQRCVKPGPWFTTLQEIGRMKAFHILHFVYEVWFPDNDS